MTYAAPYIVTGSFPNGSLARLPPNPTPADIKRARELYGPEIEISLARSEGYFQESAACSRRTNLAVDSRIDLVDPLQRRHAQDRAADCPSD